MKLAVQCFTEREPLFPPEVGDRHPLPGAAGALKRRIHQFQDGAFAKRVRDGMAAAAFLQKQSLQQIGRAGRAPVRHGQAHRGDACRNIILETFYAAGQLVGVRVPTFFGGQLGDLLARGVIGGQRHGLHLAPPFGRHLRFKVSELVREAVLAQVTRQAFFHRANQPGRAIGDNENRIHEAARFSVSQENLLHRRFAKSQRHSLAPLSRHFIY